MYLPIFWQLVYQIPIFYIYIFNIHIPRYNCNCLKSLRISISKHAFWILNIHNLYLVVPAPPSKITFKSLNLLPYLDYQSNQVVRQIFFTISDGEP